MRCSFLIKSRFSEINRSLPVPAILYDEVYIPDQPRRV